MTIPDHRSNGAARFQTEGYVCPCCGAPVSKQAPREALRYARVRPVTQRAIDELLRIFPRTTSMRRLADVVYGDDPNGGPDNPENSMAVSFNCANQELAKFGWRIGGVGAGRRDSIGLWPLSTGDRP